MRTPQNIPNPDPKMVPYGLRPQNELLFDLLAQAKADGQVPKVPSTVNTGFGAPAGWTESVRKTVIYAIREKESVSMAELRKLTGHTTPTLRTAIVYLVAHCNIKVVYAGRYSRYELT